MGGLELFDGAGRALTFTSEVLSHFRTGGCQNGSFFNQALTSMSRSSLPAMATKQSIQQSSTIDPKTVAGALLVGQIRRGAPFINHGRPP